LLQFGAGFSCSLSSSPPQTAAPARLLLNRPPPSISAFTPLLLPGDVEQLKPLRDIVSSKLASPVDRNGKKEVIYVVDDDPDILKLIRHVLELEGFEVASFTNPQDALSEFNRATRRPGLVVTDYCMEPMNGMELIQRCRETQPNIKTIIISGMVDGTDFQKLPETTDRFLTKPFKVSSLIETLRDTMVKAHN
jgi:CheY-like chemotaxis protein